MKITKKALRTIVEELVEIELALDGLIENFPDDDDWGEIHDAIRDGIMAVQDSASFIRDKIDPHRFEPKEKETKR